MALHPSPCVSHKSSTAGTAAQYVPRNGTAPRIAAKANTRVKEKQTKVTGKTGTKQQNPSTASPSLKTAHCSRRPKFGSQNPLTPVLDLTYFGLCRHCTDVVEIQPHT